MLVPMKKEVLNRIKLDVTLQQKFLMNALLLIASLKSVYYIELGLLYVIKHLLLVAVAIISAREAEILFHYHSKGIKRSESLEILKNTRPENIGLLVVIALNFNLSLTGVIIGVSFAILVGRLAYGGFTYNIFNAAALGLVFIRSSFELQLNSMDLDSVTDKVLGLFFTETFVPVNTKLAVSVSDLVTLGIPNLSNIVGSIIVFIIFFFLAVKKIVKPLLPLLTVAFIAIISLTLDLNYMSIFLNLLSISTVFGLLFVASDFTTIPSNKLTIIISSFLISIIIVYINLKIDLNDRFSIYYAILFTNMLTPILDVKLNKYKDSFTIEIVAYCVTILMALLYGKLIIQVI